LRKHQYCAAIVRLTGVADLIDAIERYGASDSCYCGNLIRFEDSVIAIARKVADLTSWNGSSYCHYEKRRKTGSRIVLVETTYYPRRLQNA
jgi:hypothetical protein